MNEQYKPNISEVSIKINQTGCSVIVAFLAEEHNIIFGKRMQIGTMDNGCFSFHSVIPSC